MEFVLILQWPAASEADYNALISIEDRLESGLDAALGYVDGHDFGSGEMNLFIHTDLPAEAFESARATLDGDPRWATVRAAYRSADSDEYTVIWPATLQDFSVT